MDIRIVSSFAAFDTAYHARITDRHVWISVTDVCSTNHRGLPHNSQRMDELYLRFDDVLCPMFLGKNIQIATPISPSQAQEIAAFVIKWSHIPLIVVNCEAGISRSPAIGGAIQAALLHKHTIFYDKRYRPNPLVYHMVLEALKERL